MMWGPAIVVMLQMMQLQGPDPGKRCLLRVGYHSIAVDGDPMPLDKAVAACKRAGAAMVVLEPSANPEEWARIHAALRRADLTIYMRGKVSDPIVECMENLFARGCF
jgi:hypothetical protein